MYCCAGNRRDSDGFDGKFRHISGARDIRPVCDDSAVLRCHQLVGSVSHKFPHVTWTETQLGHFGAYLVGDDPVAELLLGLGVSLCVEALNPSNVPVRTLLPVL